MERVISIGLGAIIGTVFYFWCVYILKNEKNQDLVRRNNILHPNSICYIRTVLAWIGYYFYFYLHWQSLGIIIFTFAAILDGVDGLVARKCDLITQKGESLDPLCDKLTYLPPLITFAHDDLLSIWLIWMFTAIELCGQFFARAFLAKFNLSVSANNFGKIKTIICFVLVIYCALIDTEVPLINICDEILVACIALGIASIVFKFIKRIYYADIFSSLNLISGVFGIILALNGHVAMAVIAIIMGQMFDLLDGYAARKHGGTRIGPYLDDIADFISFGLCTTTVLIVHCGVDYMAIGAIYVAGVAYRLIRFTLFDKKMVTLPRGIFNGLPSPAGALFVLGACLTLNNVSIAIVTIVTTLLMISHLHFAHFGTIMLKKIPRPIFFLLSSWILVILAYVIKTQDVALFGKIILLTASIYVITGIYMSHADKNTQKLTL